MIKISNTKITTFFTNILLLLAFAKGLSLLMAWYLPSEGVDVESRKNYQHQYQRVNFSNLIAEEQSQTQGMQSSSMGITNMLLKGLYGLGAHGFAILAVKSNPLQTSIVAVGEDYQGYMLMSIEVGSVIFEKGMQEYTLEFEQSSTSTSLSSMDSEVEPLSEVSRQDIAFYAKDMKQIWKDISIVEVKDGGKITGFKVTKINPKSKFASLGIKKDDLIIKLNNVTLESYKDALEVYNKIEKIDTIQVVVMRDNQEKELVYEIR